MEHEEQKRIWEEEHKAPLVLLQMDSDKVSSSVEEFFLWLKSKRSDLTKVIGVEMCCGKGRNTNWLAKQGIHMSGLDFSQTAIKVAKERAEKDSITQAQFFVHDVTESWPFKDESQDFVLDCFGSTDIESGELRQKARTEMLRVLKPGGYIFLYLLSTEDEFHKEMIEKNPAHDAHAFYHIQTGKYEKTFSEEEVKNLFPTLKVLEVKRIKKLAEFFGKSYNCQHFWVVLEKQV